MPDDLLVCEFVFPGDPLFNRLTIQVGHSAFKQELTAGYLIGYLDHQIQC